MDLAPRVRRIFEIPPDARERQALLTLTVHQLDALAALEHEDLTMRELCQRLAISESAATALSDRLVSRGMVARHADPRDRRVVRLALTDDARSMVERYREIKRRRATDVLSTLSKDDLAALARIYETLLSGAASPEEDRR